MEILSSLSLAFSVCGADLDESLIEGEPVGQTVNRLALAKATKASQSERSSLVIGADTLVSLEGRLLGKPANHDEALAMLSSLNGKTHEVFTGVAFVKNDERISEVVQCRSSVTFKQVPVGVLEKYVSTGEPFGKAGAYAIQGGGAKLVERFDGSFTNIVGLPVTELLRFLMKFGADRLEWSI